MNHTASADSNAASSVAAFDPEPQVELRLARPEEYEAIDALVAAAYAHDYGAEGAGHGDMHRAGFRQREFDVWAAFDAAGELVGSVTTRRPAGPPLHEDVHSDELDLRLLAVSPAARRRGIGAAIMHAVIAHARADGWATLGLKTAPNMAGAHKLYDSLGFARDPERDGLWINGVRLFNLYMYVYSLG